MHFNHKIPALKENKNTHVQLKHMYSLLSDNVLYTCNREC